MSDVRVRPMTELDIEGICRIDERITGKYRPEVWEQRAAYYIRRDPDSSQVADVGGRVRAGDAPLGRTMPDRVVVLLASPLEVEHVDRVRAVDPRIDVLHDPDLLPRPRYRSDHTGGPTTTRTPEQEARFLEMLQRADVVFDFPSGHVRDLT